MEESGPVIGHNLVESADQILECVSLKLGTAVRAAVKKAAEIFDRLLAVALVVEKSGNLEPQQIAFLVVVSTAPPVDPASPAKRQAGHCVGGVLKWPPGAARAARAELRGCAGKILVVLLRGPQSAARGQEIAQEISKTLVDPQQIVPHRGLEIGGAQVRRTAKLAVPRVDEFV